jgi:hypothetical protein
MRLPGSCANSVSVGLLDVSMRDSRGWNDMVVDPRLGLITTSRGVLPYTTCCRGSYSWRPVFLLTCRCRVAYLWCPAHALCVR